MKHRVCIMSAAALAVASVGLGNFGLNAVATTALADTGGSHRFECGNKLLKGTYGIQMQGTRPVPGGTGLEPVIGVAIRTFDGRGNFTQVDNVKGVVSGLAPDRPGAGTYEVDPDCSGRTRFEPGPGVIVEERFVVVDYGHEIRSITTTPQANMVTTVAKRISFR